jgi:hypothetical protein
MAAGRNRGLGRVLSKFTQRRTHFQKFGRPQSVKQDGSDMVIQHVVQHAAGICVSGPGDFGFRVEDGPDSSPREQDIFNQYRNFLIEAGRWDQRLYEDAYTAPQRRIGCRWEEAYRRPT